MMSRRERPEAKITMSRRQVLTVGLSALGAYGACRALGGVGSLDFSAAFSAGPRAKNLTPPAHSPLRTVKSHIVDQSGKVVYLTAVSWFGMETRTFFPHGVWVRNWQQMLDQIALCGFNSLRLPYSNQLFDAASIPNGIDFVKNPDLQGLTGLEIMDRVVHGAGQRGLRVILDRHRPDASGNL